MSNGQPRLHAHPLTRLQVNTMILEWHRHHKPDRGYRFAIGAYDEEDHVHGAAVVGRPKARMTEQYLVAEVTRLVTDGTPNTCSFLYGAAARPARCMGFVLVQTFILESESGVSLRAAGWQRDDSYSPGGSWDRPSRSREDASPTEPKARWFVDLHGRCKAPEEVT